MSNGPGPALSAYPMPWSFEVDANFGRSEQGPNGFMVFFPPGAFSNDATITVYGPSVPPENQAGTRASLGWALHSTQSLAGNAYVYVPYDPVLTPGGGTVEVVASDHFFDGSTNGYSRGSLNNTWDEGRGLYRKVGEIPSGIDPSGGYIVVWY